MRTVVSTLTFVLISCVVSEAALLDALSGLKKQTLPLDTQLQDVLALSVGWLEIRAEYSSYPKLHQYAEVLLSLVRPSCVNCIDYFEALSVLRALGKLIKEITDEDKDDVFVPVVRRSYVAAVWTLQRSKLFKWELTHFQSNALSAMFSLYLYHVKLSKGRPVSFHHISKCGGTTMCQLASTNRCSNPHMSLEKNCVLSDSFDGPIWMVAHDIKENAAMPNATVGTLDIDATEVIPGQLSTRRGYITEGRFSMWLMYGCPWVPVGRQYTCLARKADAQQAGVNFLANERTLSTEYDVPQVCPEFTNAVILREPVPHAVSLMAEARYRYVRQLIFRHNITSWQPPAWNLTWWETLGPALVGSYSTRTLIGRASFCRSAANMTQQQLSEGMLSLLSFDLVMTLSRSNEIDLMISSLLGWPALNFSSQPAGRVRDMAAMLSLGEEPLEMMGRRLQADNGWPISPGQYTSKPMRNEGLQSAVAPNGTFATDLDFSGTRMMLEVSSADHASGNQGARSAFDDAGELDADGSKGLKTDAAAGGNGNGLGSNDYAKDLSSDAQFNAAAAALDEPLEESPPEPAIDPEVLAAEGAVEVVRNSWLEREARLRGYSNYSADLLAIQEPVVEHTGRRSRHGAHIIKVVVTRSGQNETEVWHAFPRHGFAFVESDMNRLERLTWVDAALFDFADVLLDLDVGMLASLLDSFHYRRKMKAVLTTYTACGFAGMMPVEKTTQTTVAA